MKMCYSCSSKWICWCGFHVTTGSLVVAWIYLLAGILGILSAIILAFHSFSIAYIFNLISAILLFCGSIPVIVGEMRGKRTSKMYRPFLIITAISLALTTLIGIIATIALFTQIGFEAFGFYYLWAYILSLIISIWLYSIVYRAYKFVQQNEQEKNGGQNANAEVI